MPVSPIGQDESTCKAEQLQAFMLPDLRIRPQHLLHPAGVTAMQLDALELAQCRIIGKGSVSVEHRLGCRAVRYGDAIGAVARFVLVFNRGMRFGRRCCGTS